MPYLCLWRRNFCAAEDVLFGYSGVFWAVELPFSLTSAAQNILVFLRKSPLCRNHFFGWSKTANSSTAYGTATLKSLLPQAFAVSNVHPRPRKHLSRCTLDCGFKTPESPALRGFVAERALIRGTSLYLVLKSNGPRHPKNLPAKFGFSPKTALANTTKKLPSQRCSKPLFIASFNFSHKRPTFAFTGESGYTLGFRRKIAHKGTHAETGAFRTGVVSLPSARTARSQTSPGRVSERQTLPLLGLDRVCSQRTQRAFGTAMRMMRVAVPRRHSPAGLRCPAICRLMVRIHSSKRKLMLHERHVPFYFCMTKIVL